MTFWKWAESQDPSTVPYRNGARYTTPFGLRTSQEVLDIGGSPGHLGIDRAVHYGTIQSPFDGEFEWSIVGGVAGSVLRIVSDPGIELQVFHTERIDGSGKDTAGRCDRGEYLPVKVSDIGLSAGKHTHTELILQHNPKLANEIRKQTKDWIYANKQFNYDYIADHCRQYDLDYDDVVCGLEDQIAEWSITELRDHFAIRDSLPKYRKPHWGNEQTIHVDSKWVLEI